MMRDTPPPQNEEGAASPGASPAMAVSHTQEEVPAPAAPAGTSPAAEPLPPAAQTTAATAGEPQPVNTAAATLLAVDPELAELARQYDAGELALETEGSEGSNNALTVEAQAENPEGEKVLFDLADMAKGAINAPYAAVNELMDLSYSTGRFVYDVFDKGWKDARFGEHKAPVRFADYEPVSVAGDITKGVAQWASGMLMTGGVAKAGGLAANFLTRDVAASTVFFDRQQGLIANMVENVPELANPVTAMFATDKDDSVPEAMLKMAVESLGIGKAADMLVAGIKAVKWGSIATETGSKGAIENYNKAVAELAEAEAEYRAASAVADEAAPRPVPGKEATEAAGENLPRKEASAVEAGDAEAAKKADEAPTEGAAPDTPANPYDTAVRPKQAKHIASGELINDKGVLDLARKAEKAERPFSSADPANYETAYLKNVAVEHPQFLKDISDGNARNTYKARMGTRSLDDVAQETEKELRKQGFTVEGLYQEGRRTKAAVEQFVRSALKVQAYITNTTDVVMDLATRINRGTASQRDKASFIMMSKNLQEFCVLNADMGNVTGRALNARKLKLTPEKAKELLGKNADIRVDADGIATKPSFESISNMTEQEASLWLGQSGVSEKALMQNVRDFLCSDTVAARKKVLENVKPGVNPLRAFLEMRINGMLSGIQTHIVNVVSTGFNVSVLRPLEKTLGGALQGIFTGNFQHAREGLALWKGTAASFMEGLKMAGKALKMGDNILDAGASQLDMGARHQISYERLKNSWLRQQGKGPNEDLSPMQELLCRAFGHIGTACRLPTRLLMAEDELFKQLAFRGQLQADLAMEAARKGFKGPDAEAYIRERMQDAFRADGKPNLDDPLAQRALDYSRESTWTQELVPGSVSSNIQNFVAKVPATQIIIPFIRTPVNLLHDAFRHIPPTSLLYKQVRQDIMAKGTEAQAEVLGRWATGSILCGLGAALAVEGSITGGLPANPKLRELWKKKGIRPYSIKIGDTWYEYKRFDPMGIILSTGADIAQTASELKQELEDPMKDPNIAKMCIAAVARVSQGLKDKSYFQGITDFANAFDDPQRFFQNYANNLATSSLPYSGTVRFFRREADPIQREVDGIFDAIKNTSPFNSTELPAKYDWLTGEPVLYTGVITNKEKEDVVLSELLRIGENVLGRPERQLGEVELTAEQYSRFCELNGKVLLYGGKTLYEALDTIIRSPAYSRMSDGLPGMESPRTKILNKTIEAYRKAAATRLLDEFPDLEDRILKTKITKRMSKRGLINKDNQEEMLRRIAR